MADFTAPTSSDYLLIAPSLAGAQRPPIVVPSLTHYHMIGTTMSEEVKVTRKGQTTIPAPLRAKYGMEEGARLTVLDTGEGVLFKRAKTTADLAGSGSKKATAEETKKLLDQLRGEDL